MKQSLFTLMLALTAVVTAAGCSDEVWFEQKTLNQQQSRDELRAFGITVPDSYSFVSMTKAPPPGAGGSSYDGVYESSTPPTPFLVDGSPMPMVPATCQQLGSQSLPDGIDCALVTDLKQGSIRLTASPDGFSVTSAKLPSGKSRIYVSVSGH